MIAVTIVDRIIDAGCEIRFNGDTVCGGFISFPKQWIPKGVNADTVPDDTYIRYALNSLGLCNSIPNFNWDK